MTQATFQVLKSYVRLIITIMHTAGENISTITKSSTRQHWSRKKERKIYNTEKTKYPNKKRMVQSTRQRSNVGLGI